MPAVFQLVVKSGPEEGKVFELDSPAQIIGRDQTADITIGDPEVSRKHARVTNQGGQITIEDLGSTNGTFVNNQRISAPYVLRPGELIFLGEHVTLLFEAAEMGERTVPAPARIKSAPPPLQAPAPQPPAQQVPVPQPAPQPAQPIYTPLPAQPIQPAGGFQRNDFAPTPEAPMMPPPPQQAKKKLPKWAIVLIIVAILIIIFCVLPLIIVDSLNLWCSGFLRNIMQAIGPGSCP